MRCFYNGTCYRFFGGRPGLVSGGAGATVIVLIALMKSNGLGICFAAVASVGVIQIIVGSIWAVNLPALCLNQQMPGL
jgi:SulP family sulfate permease